jgi:hypothetical protein
VAKALARGKFVYHLAAPANFLFNKIKASPVGLTALGGSFLLLGLGTLIALIKGEKVPGSDSIT